MVKCIIILNCEKNLRAKGYEFQSNTDTEVVLNSYIEWGEECLNKFNGMWAFVIYDREKENYFVHVTDMVLSRFITI